MNGGPELKVSFNSWVYSSFPVWLPAYPIEEVIKRLARIGYDGIEIGCASPHAYPAYLDASGRRELKQVLTDSGIALSSMLPAPGGGPGYNVASPSSLERRASIEHYKEVLELCAQLGGHIVLYVGGWRVFGTSREQAWEWSRSALAEIAVTAAGVGVTLVVEPTPNDSNLIESADDAIELMRAVGAPNVKLMFDTFHAFYRNEVPSDYVYQMGTDLHHVHLSDSDRLPPGQGVVDFIGVIDALEAIGFKGYLTMEIGFNRRNVEPDLMARQAIEYLRSLLISRRAPNAALEANR
jgi:protein FrlC